MKHSIAVVAAVVAVGLSFGVASAKGKGDKDLKRGEELFKQHCAVCHPEGGNIVNPQKPLGKEALKANKITSWKDIVKTMRNPGPGMSAFDAKAIPDKDAKLVAEYILKTFK
ncbi:MULTISPECIES: c-type cytochrome [Geobacter]|uniref:Cytochrome C n=2 Tax=Geobacter TaxID=28231 RepID=A0A0C1U0V8_9BACT|nr:MULTISPECIES: c-type cytochrome [Geobacter]KIE41435.1 cytochrome C [Geobacter soli]MBE2888365.1 c-type cytochrome [Geobacter anodireducens]HMN03848.1 c-type cytochrome [Geobacter anodireducens]